MYKILGNEVEEDIHEVDYKKQPPFQMGMSILRQEELPHKQEGGENRKAQEGMQKGHSK